MPTWGDDIFGDVGRDFIEENPRWGFLGALQNWGKEPQRRRLQDEFENIYGRYQADIGRQLLAGQTPSTDWFSQMQNPQDMFSNYWGSMTPTQKYGSTSRFAPPTQFRLW